MDNLVKKVLAVGGTVLFTCAPAQGVSADEVAKEFAKGKESPVVVVQEKEGKGRTVGKGKFSIGTEFGYEKIDTEVTGGSSSVGGNPVPTDTNWLNNRYSNQTERESLFLVGSYGISDRLELTGRIGGAQTDFNADDKTGGPSATTESGNNLAYGLGLRAVPIQFKDGLYLALTGSWTQGKHDNMPVKGNSAATVDTDWRKLAAALEIGKKFGRTTYFGGAKYSGHKETRKIGNPLINAKGYLDLEAKNPWSVFVGIEKNLGKKNNGWCIGAQLEGNSQDRGGRVYLLRKF